MQWGYVDDYESVCMCMLVCWIVCFRVCEYDCVFVRGRGFWVLSV